MTSIISLILDHFLNPSNRGKIDLCNVMSFFLLMVGTGVGLFFLFEALVPLIGYVESGASVSALLLLAGGLLFFLKRKKNITSTPSLPQIQDLFSNINIESELKNNAVKIALFSFVIGLALTQLPKIKKLSDFYRLLK